MTRVNKVDLSSNGKTFLRFENIEKHSLAEPEIIYNRETILTSERRVLHDFDVLVLAYNLINYLVKRAEYLKQKGKKTRSLFNKIKLDTDTIVRETQETRWRKPRKKLDEMNILELKKQLVSLTLPNIDRLRILKIAKLIEQKAKKKPRKKYKKKKKKSKKKEKSK